jgi:hypothetical protein
MLAKESTYKFFWREFIWFGTHGHRGPGVDPVCVLVHRLNQECSLEFPGLLLRHKSVWDVTYSCLGG